MDPTLVSVIICTRNRAASLQRCLDSFLDIRTAHPWELVVVDNGSTDSTSKVIEEFKGRAKFPVLHVSALQKGLSNARNAGIAAASGDPLLFTDDDCYPDPTYVDAAVAVFQNQLVDYFGGRILLHDPDDYPTTINTSTETELFPPGTFMMTGAIHGANMGFRRKVFERIGGFNVLLGAGTTLCSGEDSELTGRASAAGFSGAYLPGPVVSHHHGRKEKDIPELVRGYDIGRGAYYASMILSSSLPMIYLKNWYWSMHYPNYTLIRKIRLLRGGITYAVLRLYWALRRKLVAPVWPLSTN